MTLTTTLRVAAILFILAAVVMNFVYGQLHVKTIVVAHIIFLLSIFSDKHVQRISIISLGLAVVGVIGAWRSHSIEGMPLSFFIFNTLVFIYLAYSAYRTLKYLKG